MERSANFRHPPSPGFWVKNTDPKRYPTSNDEATVPAALTLYIVDIVWWFTPTCLKNIKDNHYLAPNRLDFTKNIGCSNVLYRNEYTWLDKVVLVP